VGETVEVVVERYTRASPAAVYRFLTDAALWLQWQGTEAQIEPWPGGTFRVNIRGDGFVSGRFVELIPPRRIVLTWGFELPGSPIPAGSTTVAIDLQPTESGTLVRLTHSGLPPEMQVVRRGWDHYIDRLSLAAAGTSPGPDPNVVMTGRPQSAS
jgi:uncharacterized protein YndB with AHSA1/START domain